MASSRTRVRIPLRTFLLKEMLARASYYKHVSLGPQDLDRSLGRHVRPYTETRQPIRPKDPAVPRGGECYKAYPGLGNRSIFYPGSSAGSTITCRTASDTLPIAATAAAVTTGSSSISTSCFWCLYTYFIIQGSHRPISLIRIKHRTRANDIL